jgi:threonine synthase
VPIAVGDFLILRAVRESGGTAIAVEDDHIMQIRNDIAREDGILLCPEGAATAAAYQRAMEQGLVSADETAILFNCATGLKYPMPPVTGTLDKDQPIDYTQFNG